MLGMITYFDEPTSFFDTSQRGDVIGRHIAENSARYFERPGQIVFVYQNFGEDKVREVCTFNPDTVRGLIYEKRGTGTSFSAIQIPSGLDLSALC